MNPSRLPNSAVATGDQLVDRVGTVDLSLWAVGQAVMPVHSDREHTAGARLHRGHRQGAPAPVSVHRKGLAHSRGLDGWIQRGDDRVPAVVQGSAALLWRGAEVD
jgi:hypothetical protein